MTRTDGSTRRARTRGVTAATLAGLVLGACSGPAAESVIGSGAAQAEASGSAGTAPAVTRSAVTRSAAPEGELPGTLRADLQAALVATMEEFAVPGAAAGVWIPGEGSWTTAVGLADIDSKLPVTTDMVWPIRSITKSYTVSLILQLADEGQVELDDTLDEYVDGVTDGDRITLLELANMSSGNADYVNDDFLSLWNAEPARIFTLEELNSTALGRPAQFAPGTQHVYTNANINLLGAVIEKVTGEPYADALRNRILEPLGQTGTRYLLDASTWADPHPVGYQPQHGVLRAQQENSSILGPAGSMFSTLEDGRVWAQTLGSGALLKPETQTLRQIGHAIAKPPYDLYAVGMGTTDGWWGHNGEGVGFTAATFYDPDTGSSIVVYMNVSNIADRSHPADQAFRALARLVTERASG